MSNFFRSNGKLLLSGEYVVLDGATALVLPVKYGQSLKIEPLPGAEIHWESHDHNGKIWFEDNFRLTKGRLTGEKYEDPVSQRLASILNEAVKMNPRLISVTGGYKASAFLEFPGEWGLGTSSTLVSNIARWFEIDPYALLEKTFGGSGFDIAAATNNTPVSFVNTQKDKNVFRAGFDPQFQERLFFVYLGRKQNSRDSIAHYRGQSKEHLQQAIEKITSISHQMITCNTLSEFEILMEIHENIISRLLGIPKIKKVLFNDFPGGVKSLGGWGGDFILATGGKTEREYFRKRGYTTIFEYNDFVL